MGKSISKTSLKRKLNRQEVAVFGDIKPDGALIRIKWDNVVVGSSFFVPCMRTNVANNQISTIAEELGIKVKFRVRIEGGLYGLRVWRTE